MEDSSVSVNACESQVYNGVFIANNCYPKIQTSVFHFPNLKCVYKNVNQTFIFLVYAYVDR